MHHVLATLMVAGAIGYATSAAGRELDADYSNRAYEVVAQLDVLSFRSSIRPRALAGQHTLDHYGFIDFVKTADGKGLEAMRSDAGWYWALKVLSETDGQLLLCIRDEARNGGTYHSEFQVAVRPREDGLFHAEGEQVSGRCWSS